MFQLNLRMHKFKRMKISQMEHRRKMESWWLRLMQRYLLTSGRTCRWRVVPRWSLTSAGLRTKFPPKSSISRSNKKLRKSVNDINSLLEINFVSSERSSREGKRSQDGPTSCPVKAKPEPKKDEMVPNPKNQEEFPELSAGK